MTETRGMRVSLVDLPLEIWSHIGPFLNLRSAGCLARSCRAFRDIGERLIYAELEIPSYLTALHQYRAPPPLPRRLTVHEAIDALRSRPIRTTFVRLLSVTPTHSDHEEISVLLDMVGDHINHLQIRHALLNHSDNSEACDHPLGPFRPRTSSILPNLRRLRVPLDDLWWDFALNLMKAAPKLQILIVASPKRQRGQAFAARDREATDFPVLPNLCVLKVETMMYGCVELITHLIETSPYLGRTILWTNHSAQQSSWWRGIVDALRRHPTLWSLDTDAPVPLLVNKGGFEKLTALYLKREYDGCWARLLDEIEIPPLPNLVAMTIAPIRSRSTSPWTGPPSRLYPCQYQNDTDSPTCPPVLPISDSLAEKINAAPRLKQILMPSRIYPAHAPASPELDQSADIGENVVEMIKIKRVHQPGKTKIWCRKVPQSTEGGWELRAL